MTAAAPLDPALESLLAFWAEAGVDAAVEDEPVDKLRRTEPRAPAAEAARPSPAPPLPSAFTSASADLTAALAQAQALAAAAPDLPSLLAAAEGFDPGPFRPSGARRGTLGRGAVPADVVMVGGPPGADEEAQGAFAGAAGRLVDRMAAAAGLEGRVLLLHAVLWRTTGGGPPSPEQAILSRPFIDRAVALAAPRALLILGELPARLLLGREESVLKLRRETLAWAQAAGGPALPAFVSFGPDFLLKAPGAKKQAWHDLLTLTERVDPANPGS